MREDLVKKFEKITEPLIETGIYESPEKLMEDLISKLVETKIREYEEKIKKLETKYKKSFEEFTISIKGKASPEDEDDWLEWEASINMLKAWKGARKGLVAS